MGGKVWSKLEELIFWILVVTWAPPGLHEESKAVKKKKKDLHKSWGPPVKKMGRLMRKKNPGQPLPRKYTEVSMYEHYFQNFVQGKLSPNAEPYVEWYKAWLKRKAENPDADSEVEVSGLSDSEEPGSSDSEDSSPSEAEESNSREAEESQASESAISVPMSTMSQQNAVSQTPVSQVPTAAATTARVMMAPVTAPSSNQEINGGPPQRRYHARPARQTLHVGDQPPQGISHQIADDGRPHPNHGRPAYGSLADLKQAFYREFPNYGNDHVSNSYGSQERPSKRPRMMDSGLHDANMSARMVFPNQNDVLVQQNTNVDGHFPRVHPAFGSFLDQESMNQASNDRNVNPFAQQNINGGSQSRPVMQDMHGPPHNNWAHFNMFLGYPGPFAGHHDAQNTANSSADFDAAQAYYRFFVDSLHAQNRTESAMGHDAAQANRHTVTGHGVSQNVPITFTGDYDAFQFDNGTVIGRGGAQNNIDPSMGQDATQSNYGIMTGRGGAQKRKHPDS